MNKTIQLKFTLITIITIMFILTFSGGFKTQFTRSMGELWNLGHIFLFGLLTFSINIISKKYQHLSYVKRFIFIITLTTILSFIIEISQYIFKNGTPDLIDVRRNFVGAIGCFLLIIPMKNKPVSILLKICTITIMLFETLPVEIALIDEIVAARQFPVLCDFENDIELSRWSGDAIYKRNLNISKHGEASISIIFGTQKYSGLIMNYFPRDWSAYNLLKYDIYYPDSDTLFFSCRIDDELHAEGVQAYEDRFNRMYILTNGWNEIIVPLMDVKNAPRTRTMNMKKIHAIGLSTLELLQPKKVYLDYIRLE